MIGVSIRLALALGLHLRNEDPGASETDKEFRVHIWWSIHSIECLVSTITGRPPVFAVEDCTVPLPSSLHKRHRDSGGIAKKQSRRYTENSGFEDERQNLDISSHLVDHIKLSLLSQKVLIDLYSPRTAAQSWEVSLVDQQYL
jgi:hypothetical protein